MVVLTDCQEYEFATANLTSTPYTACTPDEALQEYIQNFTDLTAKTTGVDPANIMNRVIIYLFIKTFKFMILKMHSKCKNNTYFGGCN